MKRLYFIISMMLFALIAIGQNNIPRIDLSPNESPMILNGYKQRFVIYYKDLMGQYILESDLISHIPWLSMESVIPPTSAENAGEIHLVAEENTTGQERSGVIMSLLNPSGTLLIKQQVPVPLEGFERFNVWGEEHTIIGGKPKVYLSGSNEGVTYTLYKDNVSLTSKPGNGKPLLFLGDGTGTYKIRGVKNGTEITMNDSLIVGEYPELENIESIQSRYLKLEPYSKDGETGIFDVVFNNKSSETLEMMENICDICNEGRCSSWKPSMHISFIDEGNPMSVLLLIQLSPNMSDSQQSILNLNNNVLTMNQEGGSDKLSESHPERVFDNITQTYDIFLPTVQTDVIYSLYKNQYSFVSSQKGNAYFRGIEDYGNYHIEARYGNQEVVSDPVNIYPSFKVYTLQGDSLLIQGQSVELTLNGSEKEKTYCLLKDEVPADTLPGTGNSLHFTVHEKGTYRVVAYEEGYSRNMNGEVHVSSLDSYEYSQSKNYKVERTFISSNGQAVEDVVYTDGFGRKLQEIQVHGAPDGQKDLIRPYRYGVMGQVEKEFIPYARQANNGAFHTDAFNAANWNGYGADDAPYAFTLCEYEDSPLSRLIRQTGPGKNWHTAQKGVSTQYAMNTANEVRMFDAAPDGTLSLRGYYPAGALQKTTVTDEDGHTAVTYTDNRDREVLTLQTADDGMKLETYRVYDDRGMLRWVLSPEASFQIQNSIDTDVLEKLAYYYEYDALGRMTLKRLPGCMPTRMVYDRRNRMVMSQDGNQRQENARKWCYSVYDDTNRVTETGEIVLGTDITHEDLQAAATAGENYLPSGTKTPMQYTVYDNYEPTEEVTPHAFTLIQGYAVEFNPTPSGLATGVKTRLLGTDQWQTLTTYYDSFARPVQVIRDNVHGKNTRVDTQYDFSGNIVKQAETHVMPDGTGQVLESVNTYDARGRLLSVTSSLNGGTEATVTYAYDETGRAIAKQYGGTQEAISYNVRGWITAKESTPFSMRLRYENPQAGSTACYNGNISEWEWQHEGASPMMYGFTYDAFGRMNAAVQMQKSGQNWSTLAQDYTEKGITYDRNGNILTLQRTAAGNLVDNLVYGYDGNRLVSLSEKVRNEQTGDIFLPGSTEQAAYEYDANGNMKKDYRKGLNFGYNFLNLVSDVWHNDTVKVRYQYLADGTKWSIRDASGNNGYDYDGSFVYKVQNGQPVFEKATALDVQFCNGQTLYALTDQLGSTRVLIDAQGEVVQQNDFYPFGAKALKSGYAENDNRFLFSGKEQQNMLDVNTYDFGARMYDAAIARWACVDPMGEKHINLSPYNYCVNNPMAFVDPDGQDARITIEGNTVMISVNLIIYGDAASQHLATLYLDFLKERWAEVFSYTLDDTEYEVLWDINVQYIADTKKDMDFNGINNYMEIEYRKYDKEGNGSRSSVKYYKTGTLYLEKDEKQQLQLTNSIAHEFGHLLGLKDRYINKEGMTEQPTEEKYRGSIMHTQSGKVTSLTMDGILKTPLQIYNNTYNKKTGVDKNGYPVSLKPQKMIYYINQNHKE